MVKKIKIVHSFINFKNLLSLYLNYDYDCLFIDGLDRLHVVKSLKNFLDKITFIIFDNSEWYPESFKILKKKLIPISFYGFNNIKPYN